MRIAVIGASNIGANAARLFVAAGHTVRITGSVDAAKLAATARGRQHRGRNRRRRAAG